MRAWPWSWRPSSSLTGGSLLRACGRARSRRSSSSSAGWSRNCVFRSSRRSCAPRSRRRSSAWRNSGRLCANEHRTFAVVRRRQPAASPHAVADVMADADRARHLGHCGNQRLLRYDALAEHADSAEMARIFRERRGGLYLLGLQLALLAYVPILGLFAPVIFGLAFIYYLLGALQAARQHD